MNIRVEPGRYVVAVSGGVDSVALLHLLTSQPGLKLIVAHYDHGIREDSAKDRQFVRSLAEKYGLPFVYDAGELGTGASEAAARKARYDFLHKIREATQAKAIITAHHEDDLLETAFINMLRGTGRKGLSSLKSTDVVLRPFLHLSKADIKIYAHHHGLKWREDSTNQDQSYLRNRIRHRVVSGLPSDERQKLRQLIDRFQQLNSDIDKMITDQLEQQASPRILSRYWFIMLPHGVAKEVMAAWLRQAGIRDFDRKNLERLVIAAKTLLPGKRSDINRYNQLYTGDDVLALLAIER